MGPSSLASLRVMVSHRYPPILTWRRSGWMGTMMHRRDHLPQVPVCHQFSFGWLNQCCQAEDYRYFKSTSFVLTRLNKTNCKKPSIGMVVSF
jgi:hypothetical protein